MRGTGSTSASPPGTSITTFPRQHRPKDLSILQRDVHLIEIKYCEDTRPQNQLSAAQKQHKGLWSILQEVSVTLHTILLGVGGTIYNNHTLEPRSLEASFVLILSTSMLPNLSIPDVPFPALLSTLIRRQFQVKPAILLVPTDILHSGSFSWINVGSPVVFTLSAFFSFVGSDIHCLRDFFFSSKKKSGHVIC